MIFVAQASLRRAIGEYMAHYHEEPNHQGLGNSLIRPVAPRSGNVALIQRRPRLGGMLNYYYRAAA
jgi:putative transposase